MEESEINHVGTFWAKSSQHKVIIFMVARRGRRDVFLQFCDVA
jgi:hypothetical protein